MSPPSIFTEEELHDPTFCFFCKHQPSSDVDEFDLYKPVQHKEGFPGYVVKYATVKVRIPICIKCTERHHKGKRSALGLWVGCCLFSVGLIWWYFAAKEGAFSALFIGLLGGLPFSAIPVYTILIFWTVIGFLFSKQKDDFASERDYPIYKKLVDFGWKDSPPKPKWSPRINETQSEQEVSHIHQEAIQEAQAITAFMLAP